MSRFLIICIFAVGLLPSAGVPAEIAGQELHICPCCGKPLPDGYVLVYTNTAASAESAPSAAEETSGSVAEVEETSPTNSWKGSVYGGFSAKSGNTVERSYRYGGEFDKKSEGNYRHKLKADGRYRKTEEQTTDSRVEGSGETRRMLNDRRFAYGTLAALHDDLKAISYRVKAGPGLGYFFVESEPLTADVSTGPLYVLEKTTESEEGYLAWRVAQWFDWQITGTFRWWVSTDCALDVTDLSAYTVTFKTGVESKVNRNISLLVMMEDEYDSQPEDEEDIEKNDFEISTGVRYTF